jgi:hypothetical protein
MPEPLEQRLSRLTPDGSSLDRDALLFAAGRASVRPGRRWPALAAVLACSQVLTLALLWPRPTPPEPAPAPTPAPVAVEGPDLAPPPPDPSEQGVLRAGSLSEKGDLAAPVRAADLAPDPPPLRAFAAALAALPD